MGKACAVSTDLRVRKVELRRKGEKLTSIPAYFVKICALIKKYPED